MLSVCVCVCVCVCLPACLPACVRACLPVCLFVCVCAWACFAWMFVLRACVVQCVRPSVNVVRVALCVLCVLRVLCTRLRGVRARASRFACCRARLRIYARACMHTRVCVCVCVCVVCVCVCVCVVCVLRGPAAILFISRDTFSDSIAKLFRACFPGVSHRYRAICCKMGYRTGMSVQNEAPRGGIASCWGIAGMAEKVSRDRGYRSDTIAISRDMGPLSVCCVCVCVCVVCVCVLCVCVVCVLCVCVCVSVCCV